MKKQINNQTYKNRDVTISILLAVLLGFFIIAPYQQGLFNGGRIQFEGPIYYTILFASIVLIISCCYFVFKKIQISLMTMLMIGLVCLLPLSYAISYINAVTPHYALDSLMISWVWVSFFIASLLINRSNVSRDMMVQGIILSSYILVIGGFLNWFGQLEWRDAVLVGRLSHVFEYPNTYAILLMSVFFSQIYLVTHAVRTPRILVWIHKLMIVPVLVSFLLALSRGALIILPIILIIYLIFCTVEKQIKFLLYSGVTILLALLVIGPLTRIRTELVTEFRIGLSMQGWLILLFTTLLAVVVIWLIEWYWRRVKFLDSFVRMFRYQWIIPIIGLLLTVFAAFIALTDSKLLKVLPDALENRVRSIGVESGSSSQRITYYQDAWHIFKDYPMFGVGGGGWSKLYTEYQSYPYIGNQAHSFYLQTLNEVGLLGLLSFLILLIVIYIRYARYYYKERVIDNRHVYLLIATPILIHSFLDFHMTFVYIAALVFFSLGGMASTPIQDTQRIQRKPWLITKNALYGLLMIISIVFIVMTLRYIDASNEYKKALEQQSFESLNRALEIRPDHPEIVNLVVRSLIVDFDKTGKIGILEQVSDMVNQQMDKEPRNIDIYDLQADLLIRENKLLEALESYKKIIEMSPWSTRGYEKTIDLQYNMGMVDSQWWDKSISQYEDIIKSIEVLKEKDQYTASSFNIMNIETRIAQIYYQRGQYMKSLEILKKYAKEKYVSMPDYQTTLRWYIASSIKSNKPNTKLYEQFTKNSPAETNEIIELLSIEPKGIK